MSDTQAQVWKGAPLSVVREAGKTPGAVILHFSGPFTARDMYNTETPDALEEMFAAETRVGEKPTSLLVVDLSEVPYMDSMGLGMLVTQYVRLKGKGIHLIVAGMTPRVLQLLELTKVNSVLPMAATVEEAIG